MHNIRLLQRYIERLRERTLMWARDTSGDPSCLLLDLSFANQWLECGNPDWAWGCVKNARSLARTLGIMRTHRP